MRRLALVLVAGPALLLGVSTAWAVGVLVAVVGLVLDVARWTARAAQRLTRRGAIGAPDGGSGVPASAALLEAPVPSAVDQHVTRKIEAAALLAEAMSRYGFTEADLGPELRAPRS